MNSSKEDLIEMKDLSSPIKKLPRLKLRNRNQIHSPPHASPSSGSTKSDQELTSVFSVRRTPVRSGWDDDTDGISEISEDIASDSSLRNASKSEKSLLSVKNSSRFVRTTEKINKLKKSLDIIRRESTLVDEKVKSIRDKFKIEETRAENSEFSFVNFEDDETSGKSAAESNNDFEIRTCLPRNLRLELKLYASDNISYQKPNNFEIDYLPNPVQLRSIKPKFHTSGHCSKYVQPHFSYNLTEIVVINNNILELSLMQVNFLHHPLFSLEHVLVRKLKELYKKYNQHDNKYSVRKVFDELRGLRDFKSGEDTDRSDKSEVTWKDVRRRREVLLKEAREQRERLRNILNIWKAIKKLRSYQDFSNTNVRLIIRKENVDFSMEKEQNDILFKEIVTQIIEEQKFSFKKKLKEYNRSLKVKKDISEGNSISDEHNSDSERPTLNIDKTKIGSDLKKRFEKCFKPPGEPILHFQLKFDNPITPDIDNNPNERERRSVVSSTKFTAKIVCHDLTVCKSKPAILDDNFNLNLNEAISIQLVNIPKYLSVELYEHPKGLLKKKIADLKIEIPDLEIDYKQTEILEQSFQKQDIVHYKHSGVGSAESLKKILEETDFKPTELNMDIFEELNTRVVLSYKIGWRNSSLNNVGLESCMGFPHVENMRKFMDKYGELDQKVIRNIVKDKSKHLEPGHLNLDLWTEWLQSTKNYFRIQPNREEVLFCKIEDIEKNIRLQYLKLRDQSEIEFDGILIPNRVRQIDFALIRDFKLRKAREGKFKDLHEEVDPETLRENGKRRLKQIQTKIFQTCKGMSDNLSYESVVDEKSLIYFEDLIKISLKNFLNWFRWQPKLSNPLPTINKQSHAPQVFQEPTNKITMKILAGKNVPQRKLEVDLVQPFLEISVDNLVYETAVAFGRDPVWNEVFEIPIPYDQTDYLNPNSMCGTICIDLFDKLTPNDENDKFYLGEVRVPISALVAESNLCGWFRVKKPITLFGYDPETEHEILKSPKRLQRGMDETYIEMDLSLFSSVPCLKPNMADLPSNDLPYIKDHILKWNELFNSSFSNKKFQALAIDASGRTNCITRFLRPLAPPNFTSDDFDNFDITPEQCLRYISLIPFSKNNRFLQNIWLKSDELLSFMVGSVVDHCVTLVCFLLALNIDAYLVLGFGIPNRSTGYVLYAEYKDSDIPNYVILDVVNNQKFELLDPFCPLKRIYCVANGENVWGNAQRTQTPGLLRFDLNRKSDWWPLFNNTITAPNNFLNNKIHFVSEKFEEIETVLERNIKRKFCKWRPKERTNFNPRVSENIKNALKYLEMSYFHLKSKGEIMLEIGKVLTPFKIKGTIINMPLTSTQDIVKQIKKLNIHNVEIESDFGLSTFVHVYPGQVVSVWIFLAILVDKVNM